MSDPVEAAVADTAAPALPAVPGGAPAPLVQAAPSWASRAWARLREPSPRSDVELTDDILAQFLNGAIDARTAGTSTEARLGEALADCVYTLTSMGGAGATTPIGRLFSAVKSFLGKFMRKAKQARTPPPAAQGQAP